jgi:histidinol dehydrogenase
MKRTVPILRLNRANVERFFAARWQGSVRATRDASRIVADVRKRGDAAVIAWTRKFDGVTLRPAQFWVSMAERRAARRNVEPSLWRAIEHAARNIRRVAEQQKPREWSVQVERGVRVAQRVTPIQTIGCYIPGGRASLVSTLLMTAVTARVVGVPRIIVACPKPNAAMLAAAEMLGVAEILRVGGAQAVAAMAYGTATVPRVDKIFGPGNRWVDAAKRIVSSDCAVDLPAGPTEALVLAERGNPDWIAADLIAQGEHDPDAITVLVTSSEGLARSVAEAIEAQLGELPASNPAQRSLRKPGTIFVTPNRSAAFEFANRFAPEHLSLPDRTAVPKEIQAVGSIFLGPYAAQPIGDYASGTNHVLPTSGWARARGGLSAWDFLKCTTVQQITREGLRRLAPVVRALAEAEGLVAHGRAVTRRESEDARMRRGAGARPKRVGLRRTGRNVRNGSCCET